MTLFFPFDCVIFWVLASGVEMMLENDVDVVDGEDLSLLDDGSGDIS